MSNPMYFPPGILFERPPAPAAMRRSKDILECEHPRLADGSMPECDWKLGPDDVCGHAWNNRARRIRATQRGGVGVGQRPTTPKPMDLNPRKSANTCPDCGRHLTVFGPLVGSMCVPCFYKGIDARRNRTPMRRIERGFAAIGAMVWGGALRLTVWACVGYLRWSTDDPDLTVDQCR